MIDIFIQKIFVPEEKRDLALIEKSQKNCLPLLTTLDKALESKKYIAGDSFTVADINMATVVLVSFAIQMDLSNFIHIKSWLSHLMERPAYQRYSKLE